MLREPEDFSLVLGGPLFQLLRRSHLSGNALELLQQRILVVSLRSDVRVPGLPVTYAQLALAVEQQLPRGYRRLAPQIYPGILPAEVRVYERSG